MLLLTSTSDKIQVITGTAVDVDVHASYVDYDGTTITPGRKNTKITTATTTDIVASPAASTSRNVKVLHICNVHASSSVLVTVQHTDGTSVIVLEVLTLLAGERISYVEGPGFELYDINGVLKTSTGALVTVKRLLADFPTSSTTPAEVTGLTQPAGIGTWIFEYFIVTQSAATTTGQKFSVNHDGTVTSFVAWEMWLTAATTASDDVPDQDHVAAPGGVYSGFSARAKSTAGWGATTDVDATTDVFYKLQGLATVTVAGDLELWYASEAAAASSVKAGSSLRLTKTG